MAYFSYSLLCTIIPYIDVNDIVFYQRVRWCVLVWAAAAAVEDEDSNNASIIPASHYGIVVRSTYDTSQVSWK